MTPIGDEKRMNARELIEAFAARAVARERAAEALRQAEQALESANFEASKHSAGIPFPVAVTMEDGRVVMVDDVREPGNYHLEYTIGAPIGDENG